MWEPVFFFEISNKYWLEADGWNPSLESDVGSETDWSLARCIWFLLLSIPWLRFPGMAQTSGAPRASEIAFSDGATWTEVQWSCNRMGWKSRLWPGSSDFFFLRCGKFLFDFMHLSFVLHLSAFVVLCCYKLYLIISCCSDSTGLVEDHQSVTCMFVCP